MLLKKVLSFSALVFQGISCGVIILAALASKPIVSKIDWLLEDFSQLGVVFRATTCNTT